MRRTAAVTIFALAATVLRADDSGVRAFKFSKDDVGKIPAGWKAERTGKGEGSVWKIVEDDTAPSRSGVALAQTAESPGGVFNICLAQDTKYKDVELSVAFKAVAGKQDQGGGFVWRYQDNNNYYVCRMNPLEDNFRVYKVVNGKRSSEFQDAAAKVPIGEWHTLKVKMEGDHIECFLDGKKYLDVKDGSIKEAGKVGLWSKADARSHFDDFKIIEK